MNALLPFQHLSSPRVEQAQPEGISADARGKILDLRAQLRESFPLAGQWAGPEGNEDSLSGSRPGIAPAVEERWSVPLLDAAGLGPATLAEVVCTAEHTGAELLLAGLLAGAAKHGAYTALVDGTDSFDPCSYGPAEAERLFARLLWVRCQAVAQVVKAADLLLRDGNLPLVVLGLQASAIREFQQQPAHVWYRLRALAEQTQATCVIFTPRRAIAAAQLRLEMRDIPSLSQLEHPRGKLIRALQARVMSRQRGIETDERLTALVG